MDLSLFTDHRFECTPDGAVWTGGLFSHNFYARYLEVFDHVRVAARVRDVPSVPADHVRADGEGVSFAPLPYYVGPRQYLTRIRRITQAARSAIGPDDAVVLRIPFPVASVVHERFRRIRRPYAVEVVADPYDLFAPGAVKHPLRRLFRWWYTREMRRQCTRACAAAYVTAEALQRRYPCAGGLVTHYSSIELPALAFADTPRASRDATGAFNLITVGTLEQLYKAPDVLIDAVGLCVRDGLGLKLTLVGDGKHRPELEARAAALGIGERVRFAGRLPAGEAVRAELDGSDLFILPSYQEGLPRAMIEAMARGLPCIGSTVGGIPELVPEEDRVRAGDAAGLARRIREVVSDTERMARMSARNLEKAAEYREDVLRARRNAFYRYLRQATSEYLQARCR